MRSLDRVPDRLRFPRPTVSVTDRAGPRALVLALVAVASLGLATILVAALESAAIGIADASPVYLIAVVAVGGIGGMWPALATAVVAFLTYDVLFTEPRWSFVVADAREWLDLLLFLFVAVVIGRLVAVQHERAREAALRAAEANSLFVLSRSLALAPSTREAAPEVAARLASDADLDRVAIVVGRTGTERTIADTGTGDLGASPLVTSLVRTPGDEPARWVRTHAIGGERSAGEGERYRVRIEMDDEDLGAIVATRARGRGTPSREATRILALAADQLATSVRRDELRRTATDLEVAREADALKTAIIDSVSHDLRTPLAGIRATAGGLADPAVDWTDDERRAAAAVIDAEATRLDGLVRGLLVLGRIRAGDIHPDLEPHEPWSIVTPAIDRLRPALGERPIDVDVTVDLPPVLVDAALLDNVITNLVDNAARHAPAPAPLVVRAAPRPDGIVLTVEDGGPGVPAAAMDRLFDRVTRRDPGATRERDGLGIGLSVVRGLVEAMGGSVAASRSPLGGLAVAVTLRAAAGPAPDEPV